MIPVNVTAQLAGLQAAVAAQAPLETATTLQVTTLVAQGRALLSTIDSAILTTGAILDSNDPEGYPFQVADGFLRLATHADDLVTLSDMRGLVGRAVLNLAQAGT